MITALKKISWYFGELMGDHAYAKYCDHLRAHHPDAEIPTEREYWPPISSGLYRAARSGGR